MKAAPTKKPLIRIAVVESDPLRFAGFQALFDSEPDFELISVSLPDIGAQQNIDLVLLGNCHNLLDVMSCLKAPRPQLRIIVTGSGMDEQTILKAIAEGAKGYVDAAASQGWSGEPGRTHRACHYTLAGFPALKGLANAFEALGPAEPQRAIGDLR